MTKHTGFKRTGSDQQPESHDNKKSGGKDLFNKTAGAAKWGLSKLFNYKALGFAKAALIAAPVVFGVAKCSNESPYPSQPFKGESASVFMEGAGDVLSAYKDAAIWAANTVTAPVYWAFGENTPDLTGGPKEILVCSPKEQFRKAHKLYYDQMDRQLEQKLYNDPGNELKDMIGNGYTPVISYSTPTMNSKGSLLVKGVKAAEPNCGSYIYEPRRLSLGN